MSTRRKVRLSIDCSPEERRHIKVLAAQEDKTISEYLLCLARDRMSSVVDDVSSIQSENNVGYSTPVIDDFWKALGY